ncbi:MAG: HEAT repeat domain-containing protein [Vicinamibacteria bacterium]
MAGLCAMFVLGRGGVRAAWEEFTAFIGLEGPPAPASASVLSEHETESLDGMTPQSQAELLLTRSINHFRGANEEIATRLLGWAGRIELNDRLNSLFMTAFNSNDLRVRAAAIEVSLVARHREKTTATMDSLEALARSGEKALRSGALWDIALLGNRGVDPPRAAEILLASIHDENVDIRYWTVEGLAHLGTDATIEPLLQALHDDPSPLIRERAACSLAQSGMLSEKQRSSAMPKLLDYAVDPALDPETLKWVFQAMRDITGQNLGADAAAWRNWYDSGDALRTPVTHDGTVP